MTFMSTAAERRALYDIAFQGERMNQYPQVYAFEQECGYAANIERLEAAARILACPLKVNPPNWQHGRVIYALARKLLADSPGAGLFVDIGTAKGYSAVVMGWAIADAGANNWVLSIDAVDPSTRVTRNSVIEGDELFTVHEFVAPFIERSVRTEFVGGGSDFVLSGLSERVRFAFVDGRHSFAAVTADIANLQRLQQAGDIALFDDTQIDAVSAALGKLRGYHVKRLRVNSLREYAVAVRL
jgi:cephalosporin hydroxylase